LLRRAGGERQGAADADGGQDGFHPATLKVHGLSSLEPDFGALSKFGLRQTRGRFDGSVHCRGKRQGSQLQPGRKADNMTELIKKCVLRDKNGG
jgi:hypothetical protein